MDTNWHPYPSPMSNKSNKRGKTSGAYTTCPKEQKVVHTIISFVTAFHAILVTSMSSPRVLEDRLASATVSSASGK